MSGQVEGQSDWAGGGLAACRCGAVGGSVGRRVERLEQPREGGMFGSALSEPNIVLGHWLVVTLLEFGCGAVDQVGGVA